MGWRVALSLDVLLGQIDALAPGRSTVSDGSIGDPAHSSRESDHNPNAEEVVCARDFTDDVAHGADMDSIAEGLRASRDPRIKYCIWARRFFSSYATTTRKAWEWGPYTGTNPHDKHLHLSVHGDYDNTKSWNLGKDEIDMATKDELREIVREELRAAVKKLAVGPKEGSYDAEKVNLKAILEKKP